MPDAELSAPIPDFNQMKDLDAVIVGAGLAGLSMPHRVRGAGLSARLR